MNSNAKAYLYGLESEAIVCNYLQGMEYELLSKRFKTPYGEIDIIAKQRNALVFIEVKARSKLLHYEIITKRQMQRISMAAEYYMSTHTPTYDEARFDVVLLDGSKIAEHIKDAWHCNTAEDGSIIVYC